MSVFLSAKLFSVFATILMLVVLVLLVCRSFDWIAMVFLSSNGVNPSSSITEVDTKPLSLSDETSVDDSLSLKTVK